MRDSSEVFQEDSDPAQHLPGDDPVVIDERIENHAAEVPGGCIQMGQLVFQLDAPGVIDPAFARRRRAAAVATTRVQIARRHGRAGPCAEPNSRVRRDQGINARDEAPKPGAASGAREPVQPIGAPPLAERQRSKRGVDPAKQTRPTAGTVLHQCQPNLRRPDALELAHVLGPMQAAAGHGNLVKRFPHRRIEHAAVERQGRGGGVEPGAAVELQGAQGTQTFLAEQLGKPGGVARDPECLHAPTSPPPDAARARPAVFR